MKARFQSRKILVASVGVAAVVYAHACSTHTTGVSSGNLMPPPPFDASSDAEPLADTGVTDPG